MATGKRKSHYQQTLFIALFALLALVGMLFPARSRGDDAAVSPPHTLADRPVFDIPKLQGIAIDGDPADWADQGFVVSVMHSTPPRRLQSGQFDAQVRLGWDERGLLVLSEVADPDVHEADSDMQPSTGASVELSEADACGGVEHWQASIAPGVDPKHAQMRTFLFDKRSQTNRRVKPSVTAAAKRTASGYVIEALLPWDVLGVKAKVGREIGFQVQVNHRGGGNVAQLLWFPEQGADSNTKKMQRIRLADAPSAAVTAAAEGGYEHFRRTRVSIAATANAVGKIAQVRAGGAILGQATLKPDGRLAAAEISLPIPAIGKPYGPLAVWLDGKLIESLDLPNADDQRKDALGDMDVVADSSVFSKTDLPSIDFASPEAAEDLIGDYTIHATYYDANYNVVAGADHPGRYGAVAEVTPEKGKPFKRYLTLYRQTKDFNWRALRLTTALQLPPEFGVDAAIAGEQVTATEDFVARETSDSRWRDDHLAVFLAGLAETAPGAGNLPRRLGPAGMNIAWWYGLEKRTGDLVPYKYLVHVPNLSQNNPQAKFPLVLFLHGSGERGDNLDRVLAHGLPQILKNQPDWAFKDQFIVVSPQCPAGDRWNPLLLRDLLDEVSAKYPVDLDRVYLTGLSIGGSESWEMAEWFPERFAAVVPICGVGDPTDVSRLKDIPTWVFHGGRDPSVPIENAYEMVQALRDIHARVRFTVYPDYGHNSWEPAYDDPKLYEWLLMQRRGQPAQSESTTPDTRPAEE
ncbi:MAG: sugar-binding protein [Tepidisphaeraceae bacterium]